MPVKPKSAADGPFAVLLPTRAFGSEQKLKVRQFEAPAGGEIRYGVEHNGRWYDADALKQGEVREPGIAPTRTKRVKVLATPDGTPYTADYDFLNFAQKRQNRTPTFNKDTGFIPEQIGSRRPMHLCRVFESVFVMPIQTAMAIHLQEINLCRNYLTLHSSRTQSTLPL